MTWIIVGVVALVVIGLIIAYNLRHQGISELRNRSSKPSAYRERLCKD